MSAMTTNVTYGDHNYAFVLYSTYLTNEDLWICGARGKMQTADLWTGKGWNVEQVCGPGPHLTPSLESPIIQ